VRTPARGGRRIAVKGLRRPVMADESEAGFDMLEDEYDPADEEEEGDAPSAVMTPTRSLAVRRAIEARMEQRRMAAALDYLEYDIEDEE
jgi:hypothetical protein